METRTTAPPSRTEAGEGQETGARLRPLTETERNWLFAVLLVIGSVAVFAVGYGVEMDLGRWNSQIRLVLNPSETAMRYVGISHFLVATLYMVTSKRMRTMRPWGSFAGLLAVGALLCGGYTRLKFFSPLLASIFFFAYFLIHEFRDEVFFYFANADTPTARDPKSLREILVWTPFLILSGAATVLTGGVALGLLHIEWLSAAVMNVPEFFRWALGVLPVVVAAVAIVRLRDCWRREEPGRFTTFLGVHRPIYLVFAGSLLILLAQKGYAIVTLHVAAWYVFSLRQLKRRPAPALPPRASWQWLRATPAGFRLLHLGSLALLVIAGGVWAYGFRNDPALAPFAIFLDKDNFAYWTILHVTVSFSSR